MIINKQVIKPGIYQTRNGREIVTNERIKHWKNTINEMIQQGIKPPVSWGHNSKAIPTNQDDLEFWNSKLVAGKIVEASIKNNNLEILFDAPGVIIQDGKLIAESEIDGKTVKTSIEEVSIGASDWTDGSGKTWKDAPIHVALVSLPVCSNQDGFSVVNDNQSYFSVFSLNNLGDKMEETKTEFADVLKALSSIGLTLPESTTPETLFRDIVVSAAAIAAMKVEDKKEEQNEPEESGNAENSVDPKEAESTYMGLLANNPIMLSIAARLQESDREKRLDRLNKLSNRGLPRHAANNIREKITSAKFSTGVDGKPVPVPVDDILEVLENVLPAEGESSLFSSVVPVFGESDEEEQSKRKKEKSIADQFAINVGLKKRN